MKATNLSALLNERSDLRKYLFPQGFLLTTDSHIDKHQYPFYNLWNEVKISNYHLFVHSKQRYTMVECENKVFLLIGHAYEPVASLEHEETILLEKLAQLYQNSEKEYIEYFNLWSGNFALFIFDDQKLLVYGDPTGMLNIFYGFSNNKLYISSHTNLLGDICNVNQDEYVTHLINYRFYSLFGKSLPGDITPYKNFKRVIPNHSVLITEQNFETKRFFPNENHSLYNCAYDEIIEKSSSILKNSMGMIYKKWKHPAISLTGGCDSKTTLSCTSDNYEKYSYFSYISQDTEKVDAIAAKKICDLLGISHKTYEISTNDADFEDIEAFRQILDYNSGNIGKTNLNDARKRVYFTSVNDFDVEVKSWVSEVARAYYHKRFAKKKFPDKLTPRYATLLYKVFITDRKLIKATDAIFEEYINKYYTNEVFNQIPWYDLLFWEFRVSSWNGLVITGEQQLSYTITIPYNNRELLRLLLSTPVEYRIKDKPQHDIMKLTNPQIHNCGISITNVKHTGKRAKMERLYLNVSSKLPF